MGLLSFCFYTKLVFCLSRFKPNITKVIFFLYFVCDLVLIITKDLVYFTLMFPCSSAENDDITVTQQLKCCRVACMKLNYAL